MKRATIGDVAAHAGVSTATVSRVLNGGVVAEATAGRVWAAVASLEYTPNALTRGVFAGRSSTIGVVIRDLSSPFYLDLMRGIDEVAAENGSLVTFATTFRRTDREVAQVRAMDEQRVRGLIVTTDETTDDRTRRMSARGTPCVIVARTAPGLHSVSLDNSEAGRLMAAHLARHGRSSLGVVTSGYRPSQVERLAGLRAASAELGLRSSAATADDLDTLLDQDLDAIVCTTGRLATTVHAAVTARGLTIPDDLAFLTMDDFAWADALGITTVAQPSYEMGRRAAELVVSPPAEPAAEVFTPTLVVRRSCGEQS